MPHQGESMTNTPLTSRLRILALLAGCIAILGLAACGGDDSTTSSTTSSTTTATGATGESSTTTSGNTGDVPGDASALRDQFNQQLLQVLTTQQNLTQSQAECAINELEQSVSDEQLQQAILEAAQSGEAPQDLINEAFDAGAACADQ